jgi:hypothetical protein
MARTCFISSVSGYNKKRTENEALVADTQQNLSNLGFLYISMVMTEQQLIKEGLRTLNITGQKYKLRKQ